MTERDAAIGCYTIRRTVAALDALSAGEVRVVDLAHALGVHQRTARRLLQRLELDGYALRGPGRHDPYRATDALRALGARLTAATINGRSGS